MSPQRMQHGLHDANSLVASSPCDWHLQDAWRNGSCLPEVLRTQQPLPAERLLQQAAQAPGVDRPRRALRDGAPLALTHLRQPKHRLAAADAAATQQSLHPLAAACTASMCCRQVHGSCGPRGGRRGHLPRLVLLADHPAGVDEWQLPAPCVLRQQVEAVQPPVQLVGDHHCRHAHVAVDLHVPPSCLCSCCSATCCVLSAYA